MLSYLFFVIACRHLLHYLALLIVDDQAIGLDAVGLTGDFSRIVVIQALIVLLPDVVDHLAELTVSYRSSTAPSLPRVGT
jgi:hypothetical protein